MNVIFQAIVPRLDLHHSLPSGFVMYVGACMRYVKVLLYKYKEYDLCTFAERCSYLRYVATVTSIRLLARLHVKLGCIEAEYSFDPD